MSRSVVIYGIVIDTDQDGVFLDYPYLGGITDTPAEAEALARALSGDKSIPGTVMARVYDMNSSGLEHAKKLACYQFCQQARNMYDMEDQQQRREKRK
jgi:hypothetical protein